MDYLNIQTFEIKQSIQFAKLKLRRNKMVFSLFIIKQIVNVICLLIKSASSKHFIDRIV